METQLDRLIGVADGSITGSSCGKTYLAASIVIGHALQGAELVNGLMPTKKLVHHVTDTIVLLAVEFGFGVVFPNRGSQPRELRIVTSEWETHVKFRYHAMDPIWTHGENCQAIVDFDDRGGSGLKRSDLQYYEKIILRKGGPFLIPGLHEPKIQPHMNLRTLMKLRLEGRISGETAAGITVAEDEGPELHDGFMAAVTEEGSTLYQIPVDPYAFRAP